MWYDHFCFENWDKQTNQTDFFFLLYFNSKEKLKLKAIVFKEQSNFGIQKKGLMRENNKIE